MICTGWTSICHGTSLVTLLLEKSSMRICHIFCPLLSQFLYQKKPCEFIKSIAFNSLLPLVAQ